MFRKLMTETSFQTKSESGVAAFPPHSKIMVRRQSVAAMALLGHVGKAVEVESDFNA